MDGWPGGLGSVIIQGLELPGHPLHRYSTSLVSNRLDTQSSPLE